MDFSKNELSEGKLKKLGGKVSKLEKEISRGVRVVRRTKKVAELMATFAKRIADSKITKFAGKVVKPLDIASKGAEFFENPTVETATDIAGSSVGFFVGAKIGFGIGKFLGPKGAAVGAFVGGIVGGIVGSPVGRYIGRALNLPVDPNYISPIEQKRQRLDAERFIEEEIKRGADPIYIEELYNNMR